MTEPMASVGCHLAIGCRDLPQTKVVGPPTQLLVETSHHFVHVQPQPPTGGLLAELQEQPLNLLGRRLDPEIGFPRLRRVAPTNGVTQKVERLVRPTTESCL